MSILDDLRREIRRSGLSLRDLERESGVSRANISRLLSGSSLGMGSAERIAKVLGLVLTKRKTKR